jgi:hypothetical protein
MVSRYCEINSIIHDQRAVNAVREYQWRIHPVIDQSNVEMSCHDEPDRLVRLPLRHPKPQLLMFLPKLGHCPGEDGSRCSGETGNLQITDDVIALSLKLALSALDLGQNRVRSSRQQSACRCESYAAAVRFDESLAHVALELGQLLGDGRRGQLERGSGAGYRAKGRHGMQSLKALKVQHFTKPTQYFESDIACA